MLRHGLNGMVKLLIPSLILNVIIFVALKPGPSRELGLRIAMALPFIGFLWGIRVHEYALRFSDWKDYLAGRATLAKAFASISNRNVWIYMIIAAYFVGIGMGVIFYLFLPLAHKTGGGFYFSKFSYVQYLFWIPLCSVFLLFGANLFGPKPDDEEDLALDVVGILNQPPRISPVEIESPSAVERFVNGATTGKGLDIEPYLWILSYIHPPQTMEVFRIALKSSDSLVRKTAVTYLLRIPGGDALQLLQEHQTDERDPEIRQMVEANISRLRKMENV
jgi:hypothetical protein